MEFYIIKIIDVNKFLYLKWSEYDLIIIDHGFIIINCNYFMTLMGNEKICFALIYIMPLSFCDVPSRFSISVAYWESVSPCVTTKKTNFFGRGELRLYSNITSSISLETGYDKPRRSAKSTNRHRQCAKHAWHKEGHECWQSLLHVE
jgi:hypothetical protein